MIVRIWRALAPKDRPDDYKRHFDGHVLPELRELEGFLGATLLRSDVEAGFDILVITRWESVDAIKSFAGENYETAVVEPGAVAALASFDRHVTHYQVLTEASA
jgi:heme-degrading monooxygenase HmoA